jgi:iron complex outermembrane receptor protein
MAIHPLFSRLRLAAFTVASLASLSVAIPVHAQEPVVLEPILVTASRHPETAGISAAHIQVISRDDIDQSGARTLAELLRRAAVIQLVDTAGDGASPAVAMRGFGENGAQNSLVLINGNRLNNDTDISVPDLGNLALDEIDHIEIINGSAGALYGAGAVGGLVNIITRPISRHASLGATRGSSDGEQYRFGTGYTHKGFGVQISGEKSLADNYRERNEANREYAAARVSHKSELFSVEAEHSVQDASKNLPGALFNPQYTGNPRQPRYTTDFTTTENERNSGKITFFATEDLSLLLDVSEREDHGRSVLTIGSVTSPTRQDRKQRSVSPRISHQVAFAQGGSIRLLAGYDSDAAGYHFLSSLGPIDHDQKTRSSYGQITLALNPSFEVVAGGRHATYRANVQDSFSYPAGVRLSHDIDAGSLAFYWAASPALRAWLRIDDNFRFAAADEQTNIAFGSTTPLLPQQGQSRETGFDWRGDGWLAGLQLYSLALENEISYDPALFANINLDRTRRQGGTLHAGFPVTPSLQFNGQIAYVNAEFTGGPNRGKRVPFVARDNLVLDLAWSANRHISLVAETQRIGARQPSGDWNNTLPAVDACWLSNLAVNYRLKNLAVHLRVNNLFDKQHAAFATSAFNPFPTVDTAYMPAPDRNLLLSLDYKLL